VLIRDGEQIVALRNRTLDAFIGGLGLERLGPDGISNLALGEVTRFDAALHVDDRTSWRWSAVSEGVTYHSVPGTIREISKEDTGFWGAVALADPAEPGGPRLFPADNHPGLPPGQFTVDRVFRDIRYADLDNDGLTDIVSNVYGSGCVLIAFANSVGDHEVITPSANDGNCIGGHGETILTADFDGDGLVDVFLPTYERFYLLRNEGQRRFAEVAESAGISFPAYLPRVEGAAAADLDLDGDVDIVAVSEVLINDGSGRFTPMVQPFGPTRLFDEGLSVIDLDLDGRFDIVKHDPVYGPRIFWGNTVGGYDDAGLMFGGAVVSDAANGIAAGDVTGNGLPDLALAGGRAVSPVEGVQAGVTGEGPRLCMQTRTRQFECLSRFVPAEPGGWSDLLMVTDTNGDGSNELVARYSTLRIYAAATPTNQEVFRVDLRNAEGLRNQFGRTLLARCDLDGSLLAMKFVDGGNGFMAQGDYVVTFASDWCGKVRLEAAGSESVISLGVLEPGTHIVRMPEEPSS
jgi:hypothetical protein